MCTFTEINFKAENCDIFFNFKKEHCLAAYGFEMPFHGFKRWLTWSTCIVLIFLIYFLQTSELNNKLIPVRLRTFLPSSSKNETVLLTFQQLLNGNWTGLEKKYAIVIADGLRLTNISSNFLFLLDLLKGNDHLVSAAGATVMPWKPICSLIRKDWTLEMYYNFSKFSSGSSYYITLPSGENCYPCDVLPDIFLVDLKKLAVHKNEIISLQKLQKSAHLPFFLLLKGRSAYCPTIKVNLESEVTIVEDYSCNNLSTRWDEKFALFSKISNIYRLIMPTKVQFWTGCIWTKEVYLLNLTIHCSNFVRQFIFDIVDILEMKYHVDYRVLWGSLIGALRHRDVIPWSVDVDLYLVKNENISYQIFQKKLWSKLAIYSSRKYSHLAIDGSPHLQPSRAFPMCPIDLTSNLKRFNSNSIKDDLVISKIIKNLNSSNSSSGTHWRSFGYVDLYAKEHLTECVRKYIHDDPELVEIGNRFFKTISNATQSIFCQYGKRVLSDFPPDSFTNWQTFIE